jgi:hypothetical protein
MIRSRFILASFGLDSATYANPAFPHRREEDLSFVFVQRSSDRPSAPRRTFFGYASSRRNDSMNADGAIPVILPNTREK